MHKQASYSLIVLDMKFNPCRVSMRCNHSEKSIKAWEYKERTKKTFNLQLEQLEILKKLPWESCQRVPGQVSAEEKKKERESLMI